MVDCVDRRALFVVTESRLPLYSSPRNTGYGDPRVASAAPTVESVNRGSVVTTGRQAARWLTLGMLEPPRAMTELALLGAAWPVLVLGERVDPHPVLVIPGLSGGSRWVTPMVTYLRTLGYPAHSPTFGATKAGPARVRERLARQVADLAARSGSSVSVVGWSVGGCAAREVALARPAEVRQVLTLGTPLTPRWFSPDFQAARGPLPVPVTAVVSRTDGYFHAADCRPGPDDPAEVVEVLSSHLGMATHASSYHVVASRLARPATQ